ncbi:MULTISPECIES: 16S rRNA (cytosine(967)-C(5))-methyltransferase RsmB [Veillonella]|jgi:16S rRNA (cytosine967-C5)-methyltransferase|uniref:16S rRNA (cytosine(967)-C(5))-methyltransferase RsmB n=2 Tax=Veillonellaceae TaxID=31977 RepID=UPI000CF4FBEC|nr:MULTISPECIES: 16S rRNA (cytosine(967)-C(5))-methyltransferase RsmB [Veillonella]MBS6382972.1 16S rRNA (cytosine(967)-C(5))-methyltransferase RsmB [Veillonella dispar]PQL11013.1 16S rRNA (cytosine(967)-C(5))-methyltransferase RsmB [Veillonella sp. T11011-6]RGZ28784.1 16S rRNA (cytosine(967)-C(5))-methyltransferase RsmB [Veillonella sp. AM51-8BH]
MTEVKSYEQQNIRLLAVKALSDINRNGAYANIKLQEYLQKYHLSDLDRRFFTELVYGVIRRKNYLDAIIIHFAKRPLKKLSSMVVEILRLGIYQIIYMDKVPESAAVNESVKLAKKLTRGLSGFVNAVLRSVLRESDSISIGELAKSEAEEISFIYNQPLWLVNLWMNEMGKDKTIDLCAWFNEQPRLTARINTIKISIEDCLKELQDLGWTVEQDTYIPEVVYINAHQGHLEKAKPVIDGHITFMDKASMLVAHVVNPQPGERILDCCAAPGGKSMHMASLMNNTGAIMSCDIYDHKLDLMNHNAQRLGVSIVSTKLQDGRYLPDNWKEQFDRVLVDAPCSGLGILQKKLDMRWRKTESLLTELPPLQLEILEKAAEMVKVNGYLVYSTCTINSGENEDVLEKFLATHKNFVIDPVSYEGLPPSTDGMITTYPPRDHMDGFFMARMKRIS